MVITQNIDGGNLVLEQYKLEGLVGSGAMGDVYLARHQSFKKRVAIKVLHDTCTDLQRARFEREARLMASLSHPSIVQLLDYGAFEDGRPCIVMEYIEGEPLGAYLQRYKQLTWTKAATLAMQIAGGLTALHEQGIVHRDIKPANVIYTSSHPYQAKLLDLGIARGLQATSEKLTAQGVLIGTPAYMAPEQLVGDVASPKSDIYALGVLLYELIYGQLLFGGNNMRDVMRRLREQPAPPAGTSLRIPQELSTLLFDRILAIDPKERIGSAIDVKLSMLDIIEAHEEPQEEIEFVFEAPSLEESTSLCYRIEKQEAALFNEPIGLPETTSATAYRPKDRVEGLVISMLPPTVLASKAERTWLNERGWHHEQALIFNGNFWICVISADTDARLERRIERLQNKLDNRYGLLASTCSTKLDEPLYITHEHLHHTAPLPTPVATMLRALTQRAL